MPEGDTIHRAARRIREALLERDIVSIETPQRRHAMDSWPERLSGQAVHSVDAHGKNLFLRFEGGLTLYSHLRMSGMWGVYRHGQRWRRSPRRAWLVLRTPEAEVVQFDGPVLELMRDSRTRFDQRITGLGPDILGEDLDEERFLRRLREDDQTRGFGDALLDQRNIAGIGNIWKSESCFMTGVDPWRRLGDVSDEDALRVVRTARPLMQLSVERGGGAVTVDPDNPPPHNNGRYWVFERTGLPCRRCNTLIKVRGQGDGNRTTYWCPKCQS